MKFVKDACPTSPSRLSSPRKSSIKKGHGHYSADKLLSSIPISWARRVPNTGRYSIQIFPHTSTKKKDIIGQRSCERYQLYTSLIFSDSSRRKASLVEHFISWHQRTAHFGNLCGCNSTFCLNFETQASTSGEEILEVSTLWLT